MRRILVFYPHNFLEMREGSHVRVARLMNYWNRKGFAVHFLTYDGFTNQWGDNRKFNSIEHLEVVKFRARWTYRSRRLWENLNGRLPGFITRELRAAFRKLIDSYDYEFIVINYAYWANLISETRASTNVTTVIDTHDILTINRHLQSGKPYFRLGRMLEDECAAVGKFGYVMSISELESEFFRRFLPRIPILTVPVDFEVQKSMPDFEDKDIDVLFVGSNNSFNVDGLQWFLSDVYPLLPKNIRIQIVGRVLDCVKIGADKKNIRFVREVEDIDAYFNRTRVFVCPLRGGSGLKIKMVQALSHGLPTVSTGFGLEGISIFGNGGWQRAEDPRTFASAVINVCRNKDSYKKHSSKARGLFQAVFSTESVHKRLDGIFMA